jgi:hypothetical protein
MPKPVRIWLAAKVNHALMVSTIKVFRASRPVCALSVLLAASSFSIMRNLLTDMPPFPFQFLCCIFSFISIRYNHINMFASIWMTIHSCFHWNVTFYWPSSTIMGVICLTNEFAKFIPFCHEFKPEQNRRNVEGEWCANWLSQYYVIVRTYFRCGFCNIS